MTTQYINTRTKRIDFCFTCKTNTPHVRVYGDYLLVPAYQCTICRIEIVIDLSKHTAPVEKEETK